MPSSRSIFAKLYPAALRLAACCVLLLCLAACPVHEQVTNVTGDQAPPILGAGHDYIHLLNETVNPGTGSVSVRIGVPVPPSRGLRAPFSFGYDSNSALHFTSAGWKDNASYLGQAGWSYQVPQFTYGAGAITSTSAQGQGPNSVCVYFLDYVLTDLAGGTHPLRLFELQPLNTGICTTYSNAPANLSLTNVLSGGDVQVQAVTISAFNGAAQNPPPVTVSDPDGTVYYFSATKLGARGNGTSILPDWIEDRNGNKLLLTDLGNSAFKVVDTLGRTVLSSSGFGVTGNTISVSGLSNPYQVAWGNVSATTLTFGYQTTCPGVSPVSGTSSVSYQSSPEITQLTLPNGRSYQFQYDPNTTLLSKLIYPDGGYVRYVWGTSPSYSEALYGNCETQYQTFALKQRFVSFDGIHEVQEQDFAYNVTWGTPDSQGINNWTQKTTTVTTKDLLKGTSFQKVHTYAPFPVPKQPNDPYTVGSASTPVETSIVSYDTNGALLRTVTKGWFNQYELACELTTLDNGLISGTFNTYGSGAQLTDKKDYDYGLIASPTACQGASIAPSTTATRETAINHQSFAPTPIYPGAASIFDRPSSIIIYGNGTRVAETDYAYDQTSVAAVSPAPTGHDETNYGASSTTPRGNATTVTKQCFQGAQTCTNPVTTYTYDETAQVLSMKDANGNTTNYSYADNFDVTPSGNTNAYLTKITRPVTSGVSHIESFKYAYADGQAILSADQNGLQTQYLYNDSLRRLTESDFPDGGQTTISYNDAAPTPSVTTTKKINGTQSVTSVSVTDGIGHVTQTQLVSDPQGIVYTDTTYDGLGRAQSVSNPYRKGTDPTTTSGTTTYVYDVLGRKTSETYPDNSVLTTSYCGPSTLVTDPTGKWRRSRTDGLGRLVEVDEPNAIGATVASTGCPGTGEPIWVTSYTVDSLGNLTSVLQNGSHARSFTHDSLSRLLCASNPENSFAACPASATSTYTPGTTGYTYDANGNLASKTMSTSHSTGTSGSGSATVNGPEQSITGAPAVSGTGSVTFSGILQNTQVLSQAATQGTGSATVSGSEQSRNNPAVAGTGTVTISGSEQSTSVCTPTCTTIYDAGSLQVTVNGFSASANWGQGSTASSVAGALANSFNSSSSSPVTALASGANVTLTAKATGSATNYSVSATVVGFNASWFSQASFTPSAPSSLTGGKDAQTVYDSGSAWATVNGTQYSTSYGQGDTSASVASRLASVVSSGSLVSASASGSAITLTAKTTGASTNYSLSSGSSTSQSGTFSQPSFSVSVSGAGLTGGANAVYNTVYDSGTSTITVNGHSNVVSWSGSGTTSSSIASALTSNINADSGASVTASASGSTVSLTAKTTGAATNYSLSSSSTYDSSNFSSASFSSSNSGATLTGGRDAGATIYDSGSVWITLNGTQYSISYGQGSSTSTLASSLASAITTGSLANASANGSGISITAKTVGAATNYSLSSGSSTSQPGSFSSPSFSISVSGPSLTGGSDPGTPIVTSYSYDALNRLLSRSYSNGDPSVSITYDQSNCLGLSTCQNIGQRTSMTDAAGSEAWSYQVDSTNLRSVHVNQRTTSSITKTSTYYLDLAGNVTQAVYPTGRIVNYTYDTANRPSTAADGSNGITYATDFQTAPTGCLSGKVCYTPQGTFYALSIAQSSTFAGLNLTHTYNNRLQPNEFKASSAGGNAIDITYGFVDPVTSHNAGHVYAITNNLDSTRSQTFTYDQLNRITSALTTSTHATSPTHCWGENYAVDPWGNLNSITATTNSNYIGCSQESGFSTTADGYNHLPAFSYDSSGNTQNDGTNSYTWDAESQLKSAAGVNYTYDGDGRRVSKSNGKLYWYGSGGDILAETNASGTTTAEYIFFGGKRIAMLPWSGSPAVAGNPIYYVEDLLGTSRVLTTNSGAVCYDADFYPYGGERAYTTSCNPTYKFEGKERDTESGNDDFGARYYSNRFGRWLSADWSSVPAPVPYANFTNPQTLNLYSMVADDPESFADLDGHDPTAGSGVSRAACDEHGLNCKDTARDGDQASQSASQSQETNSAVQFVKDEAKGMAKEAYNTLAGLDNWFYSGVNALLGTNFHVEEAKPATPGENNAMLGTSVALLLMPGGGETKALSKGEKISQLTADAEKLYPKLAGKLQDHHIIPQYLGGAKDGATARIPAAYHQQITNEFRKLAPYGQSIQRGAAEVGRIVQQVYSKLPLP